MPKTTPELVPAVDRALRMLVTLQKSSEDRTVSDLARDLRIPKSSAHQIAATLRYHGFLEQDKYTRSYRLGPSLGNMVSHRRHHVELPALALPYLKSLAETAQMTALLGVREANHVVLVAKAESPSPFNISAPIGHVIDANAGVFGKLFAAGAHEDHPRTVLSGTLPAYTSKSIVDLNEYAREIQTVRAHGYALDLEEYLDGVVAIGAPVRDVHGHTIGAICLLGLAVSHGRQQLTNLAQPVQTACQSLCQDFDIDSNQDIDPIITSVETGA